VTYTAAPHGTPQEVALRLLAESPSLARQAIDVGATRTVETLYYFAAIARFVYAGDTPLHIAAAAYETGIAEQLLSRGAHVRASNRRGIDVLPGYVEPNQSLIPGYRWL
jgi:hypothetical protein